MKKRLLYLLICSLVSFVLSACKSDYSPEDKNSATISLSLYSSARTVLPEYELSEMTDFVLKGKKANESEKSLATFSDAFEVNSSKLQIDVGDWIFSLTAKIGDSVFYSVISKSVVTGDNILSFNFKLSGIGKGAGSINVSLTFPENAEITCIKAGLFDVETDSEITGFECENLIFANSKVTYSKSDVPAGSYWLKFVFYGKGDLYLNTYKELVAVASDLESSAERKVDSLNEVYSIHYVTNCGEFFIGAAPGSFTRYSEIEIPENIIRPGYTFLGWYTTPDFSCEKTSSIAIGTTGNLELYAKWSLISYSITYSLNGGENSSENKTSYTVEDEFKFEPASKNNYTFDGWYSDSEFSNRLNGIDLGTTGDITLLAKWQAEMNSIVYNLNGGINAIENPLNYSFESNITFVSPTRPGYTFLGWYTTPDFSGEKTSSIAIGTTGNIELYAKWSANTDTKYSVKHWWQNISDDGYTLHETDDKTGTTDTETNAIEKNYVGFSSKSFVQKNISGYGTTEVNIYYDRNIISLSIDLDGGSSLTSVVNGKLNGRYGAPVEFSTPYRTDYYKFIGWNFAGGILPATFTEPASYTALWSKSILSISLSQLSDVSMSYMQSGSVVSFSADSGYSSYLWELDGSSLSSSSKSLSIDTATFRKGTYEVYLLAEKNG